LQPLLALLLLLLRMWLLLFLRQGDSYLLQGLLLGRLFWLVQCLWWQSKALLKLLLRECWGGQGFLLVLLVPLLLLLLRAATLQWLLGSLKTTQVQVLYLGWHQELIHIPGLLNAKS
jgi:hypothetical protein